jgi:hypothetical protein
MVLHRYFLWISRRQCPPVCPWNQEEIASKTGIAVVSIASQYSTDCRATPEEAAQRLRSKALACHALLCGCLCSLVLLTRKGASFEIRGGERWSCPMAEQFYARCRYAVWRPPPSMFSCTGTGQVACLLSGVWTVGNRAQHRSSSFSPLGV